MEVHPILGRGDTPNPGLWYVISSYGQYPSMRVGHTITYIPGRDGGKPDKLIIIGGANPSGVFAETHVLYLDKYEWDEFECDGLKGRYEHCVFNPECQPDKIYIFGGADQNGNLNDMQMLDLTTEKWSSVTVSGTPPSPRTCRCSAFVANKLYVFGGGGDKAEPVADRGLHVFDVGSLTWSQPEVTGKVPKPRQGHVMVAIGNNIYLHGGLAREIFYNDLYEFNTETMTWKLLKCKGDIPPGCTAHAAVAISNTQFCIQGGLTPGGALDSTYVFDVVNCKWQKMKFDCPPPACRLDHAICQAYITTHPKTDKDNTESVSTESHGDTQTSDNSDKDSNERNKERTCESESVSAVAESKDTHSGTRGQEHSVSSEEVEVTSGNEQVNVKANGNELKKSSNEPGGEKCNDVDITAEAVAGGLTIEGSKHDPPSTEVGESESVCTNTEALTSLLSVEGVKRILSSDTGRGESGNACGEGVQRCLVCVIHGGMDTGGEVFDDCLVWRVDGAPL